ncbi:MAG: hypothetical protein JWM87_671 [Candidatus Eremiobacteraeota bacterium]|nr:hypothetical protein [Candidatus Eremiobacteraeota bacterium]
MNASEFRRIIEWSPAYDFRTEGAGIHGVEIRFVLVGPQAAIQFLLSTNWQTSGVRAKYAAGRYPRNDGKLTDGHMRNERGLYCAFKPSPADIGYHAREKQYDSQTAQDDCPYLDGAPCYYDGSGLRARHFFDALTDKGDEALWTALREEYDARFVVGVPATVESANFGELLDAVGTAIGEGPS